MVTKINIDFDGRILNKWKDVICKNSLSDFQDSREPVEFTNDKPDHLPVKHTPVRLDQDGLYYHADLSRSYKMQGHHCILACRRIADYRLAIARTDDQFRAIDQEYIAPYNPNGESIS